MQSRIAKFFSYYQPYRGWLAADLVCAVIVAAAALALPLCARAITEQVLTTVSPDTLNQVAAIGGLMAALVVVQTACQFFVDYQGHSMGARMESDMRRDLFEHFQKLSFRFYDEQKTGQLMTRVTNDLFDIAELYHHGPEDFAIAVLKFTGVLLILLTINVPLTLMIFLFIPVMTIYAFIFTRRMRKALRRSRDRIGDINAQVEDTLAGIRVVKSFTNETVEMRKFAVENRRFLDSRRDGYRNEAYFDSGLKMLIQLLTVTTIVLGAAAIVNASLTLADLLIYLLYAGILIEPIQRALNIARLLQEGVTGFNRFMDIMEIEPEIRDAPDAIELGRVRGTIDFEQVSFRYRDEHADVLSGINLSIGAGDYVALVGSSGVGKTTLCSLIPRFYEVSAGTIRIDGQDIRRVTQRSLRDNVGFVQQDVYLFAGTVADNIRYGKLDASMDEIIAAAKRANAHDFIMALPDGYDTDIGQRGVKLSGGQKQRLSIARVFLKDPPVLIFDEATSALDNESERAVRESLEKLTESRTTLVIAHRLSTVRHAQRILVLTDTGISEQGTHDDLIALNGVYASL